MNEESNSGFTALVIFGGCDMAVLSWSVVGNQGVAWPVQPSFQEVTGMLYILAGM